MLFTFLDQTRNKSAAVRERYAFGVAVVFTLVVAGLWSFSLPARFATITGASTTASVVASVSPFSNMWKQIKSQVSDLSLPKVAVDPAATSTTVDGITTYNAAELLATSTQDNIVRPPAQAVIIETSTTSSSSTDIATTSPQQ